MKKTCFKVKVYLALHLCIAIMVLPATFIVQNLNAAEVFLEWDEPGGNIDIDGYRIYYGMDIENLKYLNVLTIYSPSQTNCEVSGLEEGCLYYFAVTSFKKGVYIQWQIYESDFSEILTCRIPVKSKKSTGSGGGCFIKTTEKKFSLEMPKWNREYSIIGVSPLSN